MARQIPSKSKHRIMTEQSTRSSLSTSRSSSNSRRTAARPNSRASTIVSQGVSEGVQARVRPDNSAVQSPPRVLEAPGSINTSLETTSGSSPLVPAVIPRRRTSTPTSTPIVSRVLEPLLRTPVDPANDTGNRVMDQLQAFFARQGEFNKRLEERLEKHLEGQGRENTPTAQTTRFSKALSVSHLYS